MIDMATTRPIALTHYFEVPVLTEEAIAVCGTPFATLPHFDIGYVPVPCPACVALHGRS